MAKKCATLLTYLKGGVSMFLPPKKLKRSKEAGSSTDPAQTNPIILEAVRECYHNPGPIAHLIGKINEARILIYDVEGLVLVDSGSLTFTITTKCVKQLGLKIHQLDRILKFETTGRGDIPYTGYIEVNPKNLLDQSI